MKRSSCLIAVIIAFVMPILLIMLPQIVNDIACLIYRAEVVEKTASTLNDYTDIVEVVNACGNISGTGNHTELWVGIIIKTEDSPNKLSELYNVKVSSFKDADKLASWQNIFETNLPDDAEGYYILEFFKPAPLSWLDLRGA